MDAQIKALRTQLVEKRQASDTIYCTVREGIANGLLPMGTRLREEDLAEVFDVSRTPVREAMKKLEIEQLIESSSTNGSIVRRLSVDECLDTLEVLEMIRASACTMLMGRIPRSLLMVLEQNTRKGMHLTDPIQRYENNAEFHGLLVRATSNTVLPVSYAANYAEVHRALVRAIVDSDMAATQASLDNSKGKVEEYMRRIVGAFLDANGV